MKYAANESAIEIARAAFIVNKDFYCTAVFAVLLHGPHL